MLTDVLMHSCGCLTCTSGLDIVGNELCFKCCFWILYMHTCTLHLVGSLLFALSLSGSLDGLNDPRVKVVVGSRVVPLLFLLLVRVLSQYWEKPEMGYEFLWSFWVHGSVHHCCLYSSAMSCHG